MVGQRVARPLGRDWFVVEWRDVWDRLRRAPHDVPGVRAVAGSEVPPYPMAVHRTHLSILGFEVPPSAVSPLPPANPLRPHQLAAVDYIRSRRGTLLADEQRVGKTGSLLYAHDPNDGRLFIIGPLAARAVWHEWAARRFGSCGPAIENEPACSICARVGAESNLIRPSFVALAGRKLDEAQIVRACRAHVVFVHYAVIPTWRQIFDRLEIGTLGVDEAHLAGIQNRNSVTIESIRFLNTVAKRTIFATGTPLFNRPKGLHPILDTVAPGSFGGFWDFARRYCDARPGAYGWTAEGSSNTEELKERLKEVMIRRTWSEIAPSLPPITRTLEIVALSDSKRDQIEGLAARMRSEGANPKTVVGDLARLRKLYAQEKVLAAESAILRTIGDGHNCIAWTWHRDVATALVNAIRVRESHATILGPISGDTPPDEREKLIELARSVSGRPVVLVATMASLATAVNLSFASHEIFVELDWSPTNIAQAEMRPFDGTRSISSTYLVADCDVDQKLADALLEKLSIVDKLGLKAGAGSVESVLRESIGIESAATLSALADAVIEEAIG